MQSYPFTLFLSTLGHMAIGPHLFLTVNNSYNSKASIKRSLQLPYLDPTDETRGLQRSF